MVVIKYSSMRGLCAATMIGLLVHFNINVATDFRNGRNDPYGPYPRIPDKERLKKELEYAEECKKYITPPKEQFY